METSAETAEIYKRLAVFNGKVSTIPKGKDNPFFKSKYADLPTIWQAISQPLNEAGLVVIQSVGHEHGVTQTDDVITTRVVEPDSGQYIEDTAILHLVPDGSDRITPQAHGSAVTYMRRYSLVTILGLICDVDDDGNSGSALDDTTSERPVTQRRTRRTKAEIAAAKVEGAAPEGGEDPNEIPVPEGWDGEREACVLQHNQLAARISALTPEQIAACVAFRDTAGWPMTKDDWTALTAQVTVYESDDTAAA